MLIFILVLHLRVYLNNNLILLIYIFLREIWKRRENYENLFPNGYAINSISKKIRHTIRPQQLISALFVKKNKKISAVSVSSNRYRVTIRDNLFPKVEENYMDNCC